MLPKIAAVLKESPGIGAFAPGVCCCESHEEACEHGLAVVEFGVRPPVVEDVCIAPVGHVQADDFDEGGAGEASTCRCQPWPSHPEGLSLLSSRSLSH